MELCFDHSPRGHDKYYGIYPFRRKIDKMDSKSDVCVCCLSSNTALWPLGQYLQLYKILLGKGNDHDTTDMKPFTCSDCQAMLQTIQLFQQKMLSSYDILLMKLNNDPQFGGKADMKSDYAEYLHSNNIEVEIDYRGNEDCKDEPLDDCVLDADENVIDDIKQEPIDEELNDFKIENVKKEIEQTDIFNNRKKYYRRKKKAVSFKIISGSQLIKRKYRYYSRKSCKEDVRKLNEEALLSWSFRNSKIKCRSCVMGFKTHESLQKHNQNKHSESIGPYVCDICEVRTSTKEALQAHVREHYYMHVCTLCGQTCYKKWQLRMHVTIRHKKLFECPKCGIIFTHRREYTSHHKLMHERFICDYCGKLYTDRHWFENHILKLHTAFECKPCNKTFKHFKNFDAHNKLHHTVAASESTYCVECDIQFENLVRYRRHIQNSTRHLGRQRKKSATCPECGKHYVCRNNMMNHYRLEHLKVTNYQCQDCSRFFLNSFRLKEHRLVNHEKKGRVKNKFCSYCGRGFSNNRILLYHVRTHTGERPHSCPHCAAAFAQPFALATHVRARHKDLLK